MCPEKGACQGAGQERPVLLHDTVRTCHPSSSHAPGAALRGAAVVRPGLRQHRRKGAGGRWDGGVSSTSSTVPEAASLAWQTCQVVSPRWTRGYKATADPGQPGHSEA